MLSTYLYCKRKLYLQYVLKLSSPPKDVLIKGRLRHEAFDRINLIDKDIVKEITKFMPLEDMSMMFRKEYSKILREVLDEMKLELLEVGVDPTSVFHSIWPTFLREAQDKAESTYNFMIAEKVYGDSLWKGLTPKIMTELTLTSLSINLKGTIDRVEISNGVYVPVELKTGKMPNEGIWPGDRIQLESYMSLLVEEMNKNVKEGYVHYVDHNEKRKIVMTPFIRDNVIKTVQNVNAVLEGKLPDIVTNRNKCVSCVFREKCYGLTGS